MTLHTEVVVAQCTAFSLCSSSVRFGFRSRAVGQLGKDYLSTMLGMVGTGQRDRLCFFLNQALKPTH